MEKLEKLENLEIGQTLKIRSRVFRVCRVKPRSIDCPQGEVLLKTVKKELIYVSLEKLAHADA